MNGATAVLGWENVDANCCVVRIHSIKKETKMKTNSIRMHTIGWMMSILLFSAN